MKKNKVFLDEFRARQALVQKAGELIVNESETPEEIVAVAEQVYFAAVAQFGQVETIGRPDK